MIEVGDKILFVVSGLYGKGLVKAVVSQIKTHDGTVSHVRLTEFGQERFIADDLEGITWCRGHDRESPEARALLVAASLQ